VSERKKASPVTVAVPAATACRRSLRPLAGSSGPVSGASAGRRRS